MPDDYVPQGYQDELDTDPDKTDPIMEEREDVSAELDMPPEELEDRLNDLDTDNEDNDIGREAVEDADENENDDTVY